MDTIIASACPGEHAEVAEEGFREGEALLPEAHMKADLMVSLAEKIRQRRNDAFAHVPFCLTVEAELLGAHVKIGGQMFGPRVTDSAYRSVQEILDADFPVSVNTGRLGVVYEAMDNLSGYAPVIFNVSGLFTLVSYLLELNVFFKSLRRVPESTNALLRKISDFVLRVIEGAVQHGASIISYADPLCDIAIMGPRMFADIGAPVTCDLIERSLAVPSIRMIHLCARLSSNLRAVGRAEASIVARPGAESYGAGLLETLRAGGVSLVGNGCAQMTHVRRYSVDLYEITLKRRDATPFKRQS
ncbi:methylcobamide--CoM methyltransferase [Synergistales bacterium]|nr:methylcobamide--CoM methyltransferase [Synergistales bacterium]